MTSPVVDKKIIRFLSDPDTYGIKGQVKMIQTHSSYVFIAGRFVYKMKKPVNFGFLDYSTLEKRKYNCEREVELNSRFSSEYLGVIALRKFNQKLTFGDMWNVVEYIVKMKRIPDRYFMKNMLGEGLITKKHIEDVAVKLYDFYTTQKPVIDTEKYFGSYDIASILKQNRLLASKFRGSTIPEITFDTINLFNDWFLNVNKELLLQRIKDGYIKDCHGDLHLEHVIIKPDKIELFDCIEFNESFRIIDYVCDIAFLSMDLDYNGSFKLSAYFTDLIIEKMKDGNGFHLIDFYKSYRAYVRGKVESLRSVDKNIASGTRSEAHNRARKYFQLSLRYSLFGSAPVIIVVFGMIGAGKTTFAIRLADELGSAVISSDVVRKKIAGIKPTEKGGTEVYSKVMNNRTYNELFRMGNEQLGQNNIVILDASFSYKKYRAMVMKKYRKFNSVVLFLEVRAREKDIKKRLLARERTPSVSDARLDLLQRFKAKYDKPVEIPGGMLFKTNPDKNIDENVRRLFKKLITK